VSVFERLLVAARAVVAPLR